MPAPAFEHIIDFYYERCTKAMLTKDEFAQLIAARQFANYRWRDPRDPLACHRASHKSG